MYVFWYPVWIGFGFEAFVNGGVPIGFDDDASVEIMSVIGEVLFVWFAWIWYEIGIRFW